MLRAAKMMIRWHMRGHGYSLEQRNELIGRLGDGKILEIIKVWGPILFKIFVKYILPLLLIIEPPRNQPIIGYELDEEDIYLDIVQSTFDRNDFVTSE